MRDKLNSNTRALIVAFVVGLSVLLISLGINHRMKDTAEPVVEDNGVVGLQEGTIQSNDEEYMDLVQKSLDQQVEDGMAKVFMNTELTIKNGKIDLLMQNASDNKLSQQIEIFDKHGETVYKSDIVKPGQKIEYDKISKQLNNGEHICKAMLYMLDTETNEVVTQVGLPEITIRVK